MQQQEYHALPIVQFFFIINLLHNHSPRCTGFLSSQVSSGVTLGQRAVIAFLALADRQEGCYQRELESCFHFRRSTLSSLLAALERKGLIARRAVDHDARQKRIFLTQAGEEMGEEVKTLFHQSNERMLQGLSPQERQTLSDLLTKIEQNLIIPEA